MSNLPGNPQIDTSKSIPAQPGTTALEEMLQSANQKLENASTESTTRAFNLGCSVGLLPAAIFILIVYLVSKGGWVGAFIAAVIAILAVGGFASLVAGIARANTVRRIYTDEVLPGLQNALPGLEISLEDAKQAAAACLPDGALLRQMFSNSDIDTGRVNYPPEES